MHYMLTGRLVKLPNDIWQSAVGTRLSVCLSCDSEQSPLPRVVPQLVCSRMSNRWPMESLKSFDLVSGHAGSHVIRSIEITYQGTHEGIS